MELIGLIISSLLFGSGGGWLLVKFWAEKQIESKFQKELELYKEQKRHEFAFLLTRKTTWHEKECEVLSKSWEEIIKIHNMLQPGNHSLEAVIKAFEEFHYYFDTNRIFIHPHIQKQFYAIDEHMFKVHRAWNVQNDSSTISPTINGTDTMKIVQEEEKKIKKLMDGIETAIKEIFFPKEDDK